MAKRLSIGASIGASHAILSSLVAVFILFLGLTFLSSYVYYLFMTAIVLLVVVGVYFIVNGYLESARQNEKVENSVLAVSVFPDLAMIPVLLVGFSLGFFLVWVLVAFIAASSLSLSAIVFLGSAGTGSRLARMKPENMDYLIGIALFLTAAFVYLFPAL